MRRLGQNSLVIADFHHDGADSAGQAGSEDNGKFTDGFVGATGRTGEKEIVGGGNGDMPAAESEDEAVNPKGRHTRMLTRDKFHGEREVNKG